MSFTHISVPLSVKPNSHTQSSRKKCAKFRNPHMGAHTHISPKHRMQHRKGKRTPSVILQQMMSNNSDDSITTNSQYETQVPWLLLNLLSSHCTQDPNCKVPVKLLELHQLFKFISCNIPCLRQAHTHTQISTALRQQPNPSSLPHISSYTRMFVLDLTRTKNICHFMDKICYKKARKTTKTTRGRVA
jgi:hypothetical protein